MQNLVLGILVDKKRTLLIHALENAEISRCRFDELDPLFRQAAQHTTCRPEGSSIGTDHKLAIQHHVPVVVGDHDKPMRFLFLEPGDEFVRVFVGFGITVVRIEKDHSLDKARDFFVRVDEAEEEAAAPAVRGKCDGYVLRRNPQAHCLHNFANCPWSILAIPLPGWPAQSVGFETRQNNLGIAGDFAKSSNLGCNVLNIEMPIGISDSDAPHRLFERVAVGGGEENEASRFLAVKIAWRINQHADPFRKPKLADLFTEPCALAKPRDFRGKERRP